MRSGRCLLFVVLVLLSLTNAQKDTICNEENNPTCGNCQIVTLSEDSKTVTCKQCKSGTQTEPKSVSEVKEAKELCSLQSRIIPVIIVGSVVAVVIIVTVVCFCRKKNQAKQIAGDGFIAENQRRAAIGNPMNPALSPEFINQSLNQVGYKAGPGQDPRNPYPPNHGLNSFSQAPMMPMGFR